MSIKAIAIILLCGMLATPAYSNVTLSRVGKTLKAFAVTALVATSVIVSNPTHASDGGLKGVKRFFHPGDYLDVMEMSIGRSSNDQLVLDGKLALANYHDDGLSLGLLWELSSSRDNTNLRRFRPYLFEINIPIGEEDVLDDGYLTLIGYEYLDFRGNKLDGDVEGFVGRHMNLIEFKFPAFSSSIGVGRPHGNFFKQANLEAWAGEDAHLNYDFFHEGSLGFRWMPLRKNGTVIDGIYVLVDNDETSPFFVDQEALNERPDLKVVMVPNSDPGPLVFDLHAKQARTIGGDIEFPYGTDIDGSFTAIWEELSIQATQRIWGNILYDDEELSIIGYLRLYRQRLNAKDGHGNSYSSRQSGNEGIIKIRVSM